MLKKLLFLFPFILITISCKDDKPIEESIPDEGLQLHYDFDGSITDKSGNTHHGSDFNSPQYTLYRNGNQNSAMSFDGNNDYIETNATFDYLDRTVAFWILPRNVSSMNIQVAMTQDDDNLTSGILRVDVVDGEMKLWAGGTTGGYIFPIANNQWYHLVLIRTSTSTIYYVNNQLVYEGASDPVGSTFDRNPELVIGAGRNFQQNFDGKIDEFLIYNRALSTEEVSILFKH